MGGLRIFLLLAVVAQLSPQSVIVEATYGDVTSARIPLGVGQIITLKVRGLKASDAKASGFPLPLELNGVRAVLQGPPGPDRLERALPILRIDSLPRAGFSFVDDYKAVTVQAPINLTLLPGGFNTPVITIVENGVAGLPTEFINSADNIHVLNDCMIIIKAPQAMCTYQVTHADGSIVTRTNPVSPGETISIYALGLGATSPAVPEGHAAPAPAPVTARRFYAFFSAQQTQPPFLHPPSPFPPPPRDPRWVPVVYSGLVSGFAGLYQVNVRLPDRWPDDLIFGVEELADLKITLSSGYSRGFAAIHARR